MRLTAIGILTATALAVLPFLPRFGLLYGATTSRAFFLILLIDVCILIAAWLLYKKKERVGKWMRPFLMAIVGVIAAQCMSALLGVNPEHSFLADILRSTGVLFVAHAALFAFVLGEFLSDKDWSLVRRSVLFSSALFALLTIIGVAGFGYDGSFMWLELGALGVSFGNDTFAGLYLVLAAVMGCIELLYARTQKGKWGIGGALLVIMLSPVLLNVQALFSGAAFVSPELLLGSARASSAAVLIFFIFVAGWLLIQKCIAGRTKRLLKKIWAGLFLAGFVGGSVLLLTPGSFLQTHYQEDTSPARFIVWESAGSIIQERPVFGWGPENFDRAFEQHFSPALYTAASPLEVWFDKAHNVYIDTLVSVGILGAIALLCMLAAYAHTIYSARQRGALKEMEMVILMALPVVQLAQLLTSFDVVPTYALLAVIGGYVLSLERAATPHASSRLAKRVGIALVPVALLSLGYYMAIELPQQVALAQSLTAKEQSVREELIAYGTSRVSNFEALHRSSALFLETVAKEQDTHKREVAEEGMKYAVLYEAAYARYLSDEPDHYRARMNHAYLLLLMSEWGDSQVEEAIPIIEGSYDLSPGNPLTYVLHAMAHVYGGDIESAKERIQEARKESPGVEFINDAAVWVAKQERQAPDTSFLFIGNI